MTVGIVGDIHEPFSKKGYREFCLSRFREWSVDVVVFIGDMVDNHAISYHESDPDGYSPHVETEWAKVGLKPWYDMAAEFGEVYVTLGNHDKLPMRKLKSSGLPSNMLKSFEDYWEIPDSWHVGTAFEIDGVYYIHDAGSSVNAAKLNAQRRGQSVVGGHAHSKAGVAHSTGGKVNTFGFLVGCGIDEDKYAFEYAKRHVLRPTLGCGIVINGETAIFEPYKEIKE